MSWTGRRSPSQPRRGFLAATAHALARWSLVGLLAGAMTTAASGQVAGPEADGAIERLKPGEFLWAPDIAPTGPLTIVVSLRTQRAYAYRNGVPIGVTTVSTGAPRHRTPTGVFTILQKDVDHVSNIYSDAPMPFMQRLTWGGIALHAGHLPGYPASHGCVRLPAAFAKLLYGLTRLGMTVVITDAATVPMTMSRGPVLTKDDAPGGEYSWHPERSATGPVSVVVSARSARVVVMRNGVEIGSSAIRFDAAIATTSAYSLQSVDADGEHWVRLPLPGQPVPAADELSIAERSAAHLPTAFAALLRTVLEPGSTVLVTRESLRAAGTGEPITVMTADAR